MKLSLIKFSVISSSKFIADGLIIRFIIWKLHSLGIKYAISYSDKASVVVAVRKKL